MRVVAGLSKTAVRENGCPSWKTKSPVKTARAALSLRLRATSGPDGAVRCVSLYWLWICERLAAKAKWGRQTVMAAEDSSIPLLCHFGSVRGPIEGDQARRDDRQSYESDEDARGQGLKPNLRGHWRDKGNRASQGHDLQFSPRPPSRVRESANAITMMTAGPPRRHSAPTTIGTGSGAGMIH